MAYATYTTDALVCGTFDQKTADRSYLLLTKEAGMLYASARSVREERSKQRFALQDFSLIRVSLVKGKSGWRIGSVEAIENYYQRAADKAARGSVVSLVRAVRRFAGGESPSPELFEQIIDSLEALLDCPDETMRRQREIVLQVQLLAQLGYVAYQEIPAEVAMTSPLHLPATLSSATMKTLERLYDQAVNVSHL